ncbi:MAG: phosphomannomutase/phosphoglucomutase [Proteobacteria bacterium]|nr:phosphomannomutase/phosphoglucomutase [Pseudomonadota bacterium]
MTRGRRLDPSILREYDIRGVVGRTLTPADARALGRAFATRARGEGAKTVCVGRDGRLSSPELEAALVEGLTASGLEVWRIGLGATPMLYFATRTLAAGGGVMVTASHNPPEYNGFKLMLGTRAFYGRDILELGEIADKGDFAEGMGSVAERTVFDPYVETLAGAYDGGAGRRLTAVWDAGNGSAGPAMAALARRLPGRHLLLNEAVDGTFPAHHPDPTVVENLAQLIARVKAEGADVGIALDGDGDRIGAVDGRGRVLWGDQLMVLLSRDLLSARPGARIIADVKASQVLFDEIARAGGKPEMWRTGHSLIKKRMAETGALLAGEMSGHIFFADRYFGYDDALYAAVRLLGILARSPASLAEMRDSLPQVHNTPELRFEVAEARKFAVIDEVKARLKAEGAEVNDIDGVRVRADDGWWLLRASNTQAVLVARCEALSAGGLDRLKAELTRQLAASGIAPPRF